MTVTPEDYRHYLNNYSNVINRQLVDISKSRISGNLVGKNDPYSGPVIVKTNRNSGGLPEEGLFGKPRKRRHFLKRVLCRITSRSGERDRKSVPLSYATY